MAQLRAVGGAARDRRIAQHVLSGNVPAFLRELKPVTVAGRGNGGGRAEITVCVTPDYLAVGGNDDYARVPLGLPAASRIAESFGMLLPTTRIVDAIYAQADLSLPPRPMSPGPQMTSTRYFERHNATVEKQRRTAGAPTGTLMAGQKKDLVLSNRLAGAPGRVAIYGWHKPNGTPIQPLSTVHREGYADYSHGVRLIARTAYVDGKRADLADLLADPRYASLLSKEGPIPELRRLAAR